MRHQFTLEYWQDGDWYVGRLVEVPGVFSQGASLEELFLGLVGATEGTTQLEWLRGGASDG